MKRYLLLLVGLLLCSSFLFGQFRAGLRLGLSSTQIEASDFTIFNKAGVDTLSMALEEANYGIHAGLVFQIRINKLYIQPEVLFNSNSITYNVTDLDDPDLPFVLKEEKYQYLDIPVLIGTKFGPIRLQAGPVGHVYVNSVSELTDFDNYEALFANLTLGYQAGIGLDIWNLSLDVRYEGNFTKLGDHFTFYGEEYSFDQAPARFLFSLAYMFSSDD